MRAAKYRNSIRLCGPANKNIVTIESWSGNDPMTTAAIAHAKTNTRKKTCALVNRAPMVRTSCTIYSSLGEGDVFGFGTINVIRSSSSVVSTLIFPQPKPYMCIACENIFPVIDRASAGGPAFAKTKVADVMQDKRTAAITPLFAVGFFAERINHIPPKTIARLKNNPLMIVCAPEIPELVTAAVELSTPLSSDSSWARSSLICDFGIISLASFSSARSLISSVVS